MADALDTLLRLRRLDVAAAKRDLAACLRQEMAARNAVAVLRAVLAREIAHVPAEAAHPLATGFAHWLPEAARAIAAAELARAQTMQASESARGALAARQGALKAATLLSDERRLAANVVAGRKTQRGLDELGARSSARPSADQP